MYKQVLSGLSVVLLLAGIGGCGGVKEPESRSIVAAPLAPGAAPAPPATAPSDEAKEAAPPPSVPADPVPPAESQPAPSTPVSPPPAVTPAAPVLRPLAFSSVSKGSYSGVAERKAVLLTDAAQWNQHWQVHSAHQVPVPPAPAADFSQSALLAVYMGEQTSGGHSITVTDVQEENGKLIVTVKQTAPGPNSIVTMALTQPYHIVRIPAVSKDTRVEVNWQ